MSEQPTVFYSWQSDREGRTNRSLIEAAIELAVKEKSLAAQQSLRLDADTKGIPGSPNIPAVLFEKISSSAIFVGDVTLVHNRNAGRRRTPNPNVLLELGFASHCLGWKRVVLVMNTHFGAAERLPFDLQQHRFPICYASAPEDTSRAEVRKDLASRLAAAFGDALVHDHLQAERMMRRLDRSSFALLVKAKAESWPWFNDDEGTITAEVRRLLDVGAIYLNPGRDHTYAYHFTYLGELTRDLCFARSRVAAH